MGLILDSSVLIAAERERFDLPALLRDFGTDPFHIAAITASELLHGVERASPARRESRSLYVERILSTIEAIDFDLAVARRHAQAWAALETTGRMVGARDLQIAATALHYDHGLVTLNSREFERIAGLRLVDTRPYLLN